MKQIMAWTALIISSFSINAVAEDFQYGAAFNLSSMNLSDPDGSTQTTTTLENIQFTARFSGPFRYSNYITEVGFHKYHHEPDDNKIGQDTHTWSFSGGLEKRLAVSSRTIFNGDLYYGGQLGIEQNEHASRHTIDSDGFLKQYYEPRSATVPFLRAQIAYYKDFKGRFLKNASWALIPSYQQSLGDGYSGLNISAQILF